MNKLKSYSNGSIIMYINLKITNWHDTSPKMLMGGNGQVYDVLRSFRPLAAKRGFRSTVRLGKRLVI
jgi:hypothetical protein